VTATFAVILPAAGKSSRFKGKEKKPFATLEGRPVWLRSAELFVTRPEVKQVVIAIAADDRELFQRRYAANIMFLNIKVVEGGTERVDSVSNALAQLDPAVNFVAIHDAVRPCAPAVTIDSVFQMAQLHGAAMLGIPVADTLKQVNASMQVTGTQPRSNLWLAQTPQVFRRDWLEEAYRRRGELKGDITDDAQLLEATGHTVKMVPGAQENIKITANEDLAMAERFLKSRKPDPVKARGPFDDDLFR